MEQHQSAQDEAPHSDFLMLVQDDSMKNAGIRAGDRVEIAACDHVEPGQIALVRSGASIYCVSCGKMGKSLRLQTRHTWPKYSPVTSWQACRSLGAPLQSGTH